MTQKTSTKAKAPKVKATKTAMDRELKALAEKPAKKGKGAEAPAAAKKAKKAAPADGERTSRKTEAIAMMRRKDGATLEQLQNMPGRSVWLPHSVRGFISTLGKTLAIESTVVDGKRTYYAK
jgi:hypothetical protein